MKALKFFRKRAKKGFTITECIVAIGIFAVMSAIVMEILALSIKLYSRNNHIEKDMDEQIRNIVGDENALVERSTFDLAINFFKEGSNSKITSIKVPGIRVLGNEEKEDATGRFDIGVIDISGSSLKLPDKDKDKNNAGMVTDEIHFYGTKNIDTISVTSTEVPTAPNVNKITLKFKVADGKKVLPVNETNALKISLPDEAKDAVVSIDALTKSKLACVRLSDTNFRFYALGKNVDTSNCGFTINFTLDNEAYEEWSLAKFATAGESDSSSSTITVDDKKVGGIYTHEVGT